MRTTTADEDLTVEQRERARAFHAAIVDLLVRNRITPQWRPYVAVFLAPGLPPRVLTRGALARELRVDDDLGGLAREVLVRRVQPNEVLLVVATDAVTRAWPMRIERVRGGPDFTIVPCDAAVLELLAT